ncbi:MAG: carbohydrate-binding protein, partial [Flavobacteriia bacterium]|nr:carbohydrate-binding protein [Flavobacteriia bacterium]
DAIRDLGIYLYTTEQTAVEEYWFDTKSRNFGPNQGYSLVSRVWGNSYDNGTFWTADIAASYGIELYPIHGGSMYLGHDTTYAQNLWAEMEQNTGVLTNPANPNLWHDTYWKYLAFIDPDKALGLYDSYPNRSLKFGISDAQTYYWLHTMKTLGRVETGVTSDHPLAVVFNNNGDITYVAQNYGSTPLQIQFSDGFQWTVPPKSFITSKDISVSGQLSSSFNSAHAGGGVDLTLQTQGSGISSVAFYNGNSLIGSTTQPPYQITAAQLPLGRHQFQARIYKGTQFVLSNSVEVIVGDQVPYNNAPASIPGVLQAGHFDSYEGGTGQGIAYQDMTPNNLGDTRMNESVDVFDAGSEGHAIGWIGSGEWVEYTVDVQQAGLYSMSYRFASDNQSGGGPFGLSSDGQIVKSGLAVGYTNGWNSWSSQTVSNIPLKAGVQVLRIFFDHGEFNLGKLTFTYDAPLNYSQPVADAGADQLVVLPQNTAVLDGSASTDPGGASLNYQWTQVYGPSVLQLAAPGSAQTTVSGLTPGVYLLRLDVDNGSYSDQDQVYLISSTTNNLPPAVVIQSPADQSEFFENETITILAVASDINDSVAQVHFRLNGQWLGTDAQAPFDANNPTITFIPSIAGMGSPTCILYYGTNPSNMPGYIVTPNVPYPINAAQGSTVYFYYTYSYPGQGERNNSANKDSYVIGSCKDLSVIGQQSMDIQLYPNPVKDALHFRWTGGPLTVEVFSVNGQLLGSHKLFERREALDMSGYSEGLYIVKMSTQNGPMQTARVVKKP